MSTASFALAGDSQAGTARRAPVTSDTTFVGEEPLERASKAITHAKKQQEAAERRLAEEERRHAFSKTVTQGIGILVFGVIFSAFMGWWHKQQWYGKHQHSDGRPKLSWEQAQEDREAMHLATAQRLARLTVDLAQAESKRIEEKRGPDE